MTDVVAVEKLISDLRAANVKLWVDGEKLKFSAPPGVMTDRLRTDLSLSKAALIEWLQQTVPVAQHQPSSIPLVERGDDVMLSFGQERLWFLYEMEPESPAYNISNVTRVAGPLDYASLRQSFHGIVNRHEVLRTTISADGGRPRPVIACSPAIELPLVDLRHLEDRRREEVVRQLIDHETRRPFDLFRGPTLRTALLRTKDDEHVLLITLHHAFCDGWSLQVIYRELAAFYEAGRTGRPNRLSPLRIQYADYSSWQRGRLGGDELQSQLSYWKGRLQNAPSALELPTDRPRPAVQSFAGARQEFVLSKSLSDALLELGRREGATLFMTLMAAFQTLLYRYTGQNDVVVGSPIAGRTRAEAEELIGLFMNTLVFRAEMSRNLRFSELLAQVRLRALEAYAHQDLSFEKLVGELQPERHLSRTPLFQVMFVLQNVPSEALEFSDLTLKPLSTDVQTSKFDLTLEMQHTRRGLTGSLEYNTDLFDGATIRRMLGHFEMLLAGIVADPDQPLAELPLLSESERKQQLVEWNSTEADYSKGMCIHDLFEAQSDRTPDEIAVVFEGEQVTYRELNARANQLARHLTHLGVGPEVLVGVCMERSLELMVGLLGILKAGGAYVPLDPEYPQQRLEVIVTDARVSVLLTQDSLVERLEDIGVPVLRIDGDWPTIQGQPRANSVRPVHPDNLAYVMFTSGSTGRPKGVQIQHRSIVNFIETIRLMPGVTQDDAFVSVTTISFDISVLELFVPLLTGARLIVAGPDTVRDGQQLAELATRSGATIMQGTPATWRLLLEAGWQGTTDFKILIGGQALSRELATELLSGRTQVWNMYGPTETTIWSCVDQVHPAPDAITIGRPIANTQVYVLDRSSNPLPTGVPGELYIGGDGLSRGYRDRPELTATSFVPSPFEDGRRLYRTGDRVRYVPDGRTEFLGRIDHQVKIRGFRIELGEIETTIERHPSVRQAFVTVRQDKSGTERLCAYILPDEQAAPAALELRQFVAARLPEYMVPSSFTGLDTVPLTPNGKVDRRALPAPDYSSVETSDAAPRTPHEEIISGIWCDVLGVERVGVHDNFFHIGGHSLLATQVISRTNAAFGVELGLRQLFEDPTVAGLASHVETAINKGDRVRSQPLVPLVKDGTRALSFAQERLWFLDQLEPNSSAYNISSAVGLTGRLNVEALEQAFGEIVRRHETLRTTFSVVNERPTQVIEKSRPFSFRRVDLSALSGYDRRAQSRILASQEAARPFDLSRGRLIRATLIRLADEEYGVLLTVHHVVWDGWSLGVLVKELSTLYQVFSQARPSSMPDLSVQYADYAAWQRQWLEGGPLEAQLSYWKDRLEGAPTSLNLRTDRPRPPVQTFRGASRDIQFSKDLSDALNAVSRRQGATLFMTLLAAFYALLYRHTGQKEILVGTPIAGRTREEVEGLIGFFANTLVMRGDVHGTLRFDDLLAQVREAALGAYTHQDVPFEKLVDELHVPRDLSRSPLFQVMFVLQNARTEELRLSDLTFRSLESEHGSAKFDLTLTLAETPKGLRGSLEYNTDLFDEGTVQRMLGHFGRLLEGVGHDPSQRLSELPLLTNEEREQLTGWNATEAPHPQTLVHHLFESQARTVPDRLALSFEHEQLTYEEVNRRTNQMARHLRSLGVGPDILVGLYVDRSLDMALGLLAILKAGAAYVPLDRDYPLERLAFMISDSGIRVLLTKRSLAQRLPEHAAREVCLDTESEAIARQSGEPLDSGAEPENLAYTIYTSGSTGRPKGVSLSHRSLSNLIGWQVQRSQLSPGARTAQFASISFDVSFQEVLSTWSSGGTLLVLSEELKLDAGALLRFLADHEVERVFLPYVALRQLADVSGQGPSLPHLREVITAGEQLQLSRGISEFFESLPQCALDNQYGPTEGHVVTAFKLTGRRDLWPALPPIGRPVCNTHIHLLDSSLQLVPVGVAGELHIGGVQVARSYLNRPGLTGEKFVPDPFSTEPGGRLYKTGDLARYLPDGNVEFVGRIDHQVKIRGFRIEVGEIEAALAKHPDVREAVVLARDDQVAGKRLAAYVTTDRKTPLGAKELRDFLRNELPEYMVPAAFVTLESFPLTPNRKIDRRAFPEPEPMTSEREGTYAAASTPQEEILVDMWSQLLGIAGIGVHQNFFELGGHSLLATQLMSRVREAFTVDLPVRTIFENPTVAGLAAAITVAGRGGLSVSLPRVARGSRAGAMPLSYAQQRLWLLDRMEPGNTNYILPAGLRLNGRLNVPALNQALDEIVCRHDTLRATFSDQEGTPVQTIVPPRPASFPIVDLRVLSSEERERTIGRLAQAEARRPFDLARGPLLRIVLLHLGEQENAILFTMHHIAWDGWSIGVLLRELSAIYHPFSTGGCSPLSELPLQYSDFAEWQRQLLQGDALEAQLDYWRRRLGGQLPVLGLPRGREPAAPPAHEAGSVTLTISGAVANPLRQLCRDEKATLYMTLLAAFQALLHQHTGDEDIVVGTDMAGRNDVNLEGLIGFFVNLLVMRTDLGGNPTFRQLLHRVRETALGAYAHQDVPFVKLVEQLQPQRHVSNTPLFQVLFVLQNTPTEPLELPGLTFERIKASGGKAKFDLAVFVAEAGDRLFTEWVYDTDLFTASQIGEMAQHYERLLQHVVAEPNVRLKKMTFQTHYNKGPKPMDKKVRLESKIAKLKRARPSAIDLAELSLTKTRYFDPEHKMPLVIEPAMADVDLVDWAQGHRDYLEAELLKHGAILFRGFETSIPVFERFASTIATDLIRDYGDLPQEKGQHAVYHSTPYPSDQTIEFHNESSHCSSWPMKQFFMCVQPSKEGGTTPIVDCRRIYQLLDPAIRRKFEERQLIYIRNYTPKLDVGWQAFFHTNDRSVVEERCREDGIEFEWRDGDCLKTRTRAPGVVTHPVSGEKSFFNQVQLHHVYCLPAAYRDSVLAMFSKEDLPRSVCYGDGSPIGDDEMAEICRVYAEVAVEFPWQKGDIIMLDNMLVAHARRPYVGDRKIVVAMGQMIRSKEV